MKGVVPLPIAVPPDLAADVRARLHYSSSDLVSIHLDLEKQQIEYATVRASFQVNSFSRTCLLEGLDELGYILRHDAQIKAFEAAHR